MKKVLLSAIMALGFVLTFAANGNESDKENSSAPSTTQIEGKIVDKISGESLAGVALQLENSNKKYYTDFDGNFVIDGITPGNYNIDILYVSYKGITIKDVTAVNTEVKLKVELESLSSEKL